MQKIEKIYKADGYQAKGGLDKGLTNLLTKITKKYFISTRAIRSRGQKLEMEKEKLLLRRW